MSYSYTDLLALLGIGAAHPGGLGLTRAIFEELEITEDTFILEVGCGTGQTTDYLISNFPCSLFAMDAHPIMIQKAAKRLKQQNHPVILLEGITENIPYKDHKFDYVLSESVTIFTNIEESLHEYYRVLKHGGVLILNEMTEIQPLLENERRELQDFYGIQHLLNEPQWKEQLSKAGFQEIKTISISEEDIVSLDEDFTEFDMTGIIDLDLFNKLDRHEALTEKYKQKLGFRVFICKK